MSDKPPDNRCGSELEFGDNYGDNSTTFYCMLPAGHDGPHVESGKITRRQYSIVWTEVHS